MLQIKVCNIHISHCFIGKHSEKCGYGIVYKDANEADFTNLTIFIFFYVFFLYYCFLFPKHTLKSFQNKGIFSNIVY